MGGQCQVAGDGVSGWWGGGGGKGTPVSWR